MKKLLFTTLYVIRLSIDNVLGLIKSTINLAVAVKAEMGDLGNAALTQLIADNEKFEPTVKNPRKSELTDLVILTNDERKERFAEIKRTVKLHLRGRDEQKKMVAEALEFFFSTYWSVINEPMNSVTGVLNGMFEKYKSDTEVQAAAAAIGIDTLLAEFETCNNDFDSLYNQRIANDSAQELSASEQKTTVCNSYSQFCIIVEQAANFTPSESIIKLFKNMDELRKTYHAYIPNGKGKDKTDPDKEA